MDEFLEKLDQKDSLPLQVVSQIKSKLEMMVLIEDDEILDLVKLEVYKNDKDQKHKNQGI